MRRFWNDSTRYRSPYVASPAATSVRIPPLLTRATSDLATLRDRKSTRLNSSHGYISYAVFCLKKKKLIGVKEIGKTNKTCEHLMLCRNPCAQQPSADVS